MQKRLLPWFTFFLVLPAVIFSLPPTENAHGIIVKFKNTDKKTFKMRDQLHAQMGTKLIYRPRRSPFDFVVPKSEDTQHDFTELTKLCENYQRTGSVECEINFDLFARGDDKAEGTAAAPTAPTCALTPVDAGLLKDGTLSPYWSQEMVGTDLSAFPRNATRMGVAVKVALLDTGYGDLPAAMQKKLVPGVTPAKAGENHGALSLGLITGPLPFTLQAPLEITHLFEVHNTVDYLKVLETLEESKVQPAVIQIGMSLGRTSAAVREVMKRLAQKSILVAAAGTDWPAEMEANERDFPGILVGSLSPDGYPTASSAAGPNLAISVPSDRYLQSSLDGKNPVAFGGSSGASALVASVIAAGRSLVPSLTEKEARQILETTALPTPGSLNGNRGYAGLNAVRFLAVVDRIRSQNLEGKLRDRSVNGGPTGRLYNFKKEVDFELTRAQPVMDNPAASCEARKVAFNQMRRAFLLDPTSATGSTLAKGMVAQGLTANARFIEGMDKAGLLVRLMQDVVSPDDSVRIGAARVAGTLGMEGVEMLVKFAEANGRSPASESAPTYSTAATLKAITATMPEEARKQLLDKVGAQIR